MKNYNDLLNELRQVAKIGNHKTALDRVETLLTRLVDDVESMHAKLIAAGVGAVPPAIPVLVEPAPPPTPALVEAALVEPVETEVETGTDAKPEAEAAPVVKKTVSKTKRRP